jgi:glycosyltransferase involved in cell wall biosynthesis
MITPGQTGLLAGFFDVDQFVTQASAVLQRPEEYRHLGENGRRLIHERYSLDVCLPQMERLYERVMAGQSGAAPQSQNST